MGILKIIGEVIMENVEEYNKKNSMETHIGDLYEKYGLPRDWCPKNGVPVSKKIHIIRENRTKKK